ncbi:MAG TPA: 6-hydroxymethylpterin diphosphokinase MptE-like protein [Vicinamibacterales bacterium]|jgi:hypothetical protein
MRQMSEAALDPGSERVLQANLDVLRRSRGGVFEIADVEPYARLEDGSPMAAVVQASGGRWVRLHSARDPLQEADNLVAPAFAAGDPPLVIVIGLGLGYVVDAIERRSTTTKVLALEPLPATARFFLARRDWTQFFETERLTLLVGPRYRGAIDAWKLVAPAHPVPFIVSPVLLREFSAAVEQARIVADRVVVGARSNAEAGKRFVAPYLLNTLENVPVIASEGDVASLFGQFSGIPAILVAAGPSLDGNLPNIARMADRACVIAVDTALRPLLAAGIVPPLVVGLDPSERNGRHLRGIDDVTGVWLVGEGSLDPPAFDAFAGRTFTFRVSDHEPWPWLKEQGLDRGTLEAWGSVLTSTFDLACRMGCNPIVFTGADLAYTSDLAYCRNTVYEADWTHLQTDDARRSAVRASLEGNHTIETPDVGGRPVRTAPHFVQFRDWLAARIVERSDIRVINATGGGILHGEGIEQRSPGDMALPTVAVNGLRASLAAAWRRGDEARWRAARLLAGRHRVEGDRPLIDRWFDFAAGAASRRDIAVTLGCSLRQMADATNVSFDDSRLRTLPGGRPCRTVGPQALSGWFGEGATVATARTVIDATLAHVHEVREDGTGGWHRAVCLGLGFRGTQTHAVALRPVGRSTLYIQLIDLGVVVVFDFAAMTHHTVGGGDEVDASMARIGSDWYLCAVGVRTDATVTDLRIGICNQETGGYEPARGDPDKGFDMAEPVVTTGLGTRHPRGVISFTEPDRI